MISWFVFCNKILCLVECDCIDSGRVGIVEVGYVEEYDELLLFIGRDVFMDDCGLWDKFFVFIYYVFCFRYIIIEFGYIGVNIGYYCCYSGNCYKDNVFGGMYGG